MPNKPNRQRGGRITRLLLSITRMEEKFTKRIITALAVLAVPLFAASLQAQTYSIDWYTIDGGGGTSTGGVFTVNGTAGQPDAGTMRGGNFSLTGGFWAPYALQTPGAPYLWVTLTATNTVCVVWPVSDTAWELQATTDLTGTSVWTAYPYTTNGPRCIYVEPSPTGKKFYRLHKP